MPAAASGGKASEPPGGWATIPAFMHALPPASTAAFRDLRRTLLRRRLQAAGPRLGAAVAGIACVVSAFAYWQVRVPLDGARRAHGEPAAVAVLAGALAALALAGAALAAARQESFRRRVPGPEWLALPVSAGAVGAHLAAEARLAAFTVLPPAAAVLAAGIGLLAPVVLVALGLAFLGAWRLAADAAIAWTRRAAPPARAAERALPGAARWLAADARRPRTARRAPARWRRSDPVAALAALDALATRRPGAARARAVFAATAGLASVLVWFDGAEPMLRRAQSFAGLAIAAAALGAWAVQRAADAPPNLHRPLPVALRHAWLARALPLAAVLLAVTVASAGASTGLPVAARLALVPAGWPVAFGIAALGLHYGLTLSPDAGAAEGVYTAWLGAALTASLMIPLLGWVVMLAGLAHTTARLRRWWTPETP